MNNVWSAVLPIGAATNTNTVAIVTGVLNGVVTVFGCVAGGWIADRVGRWWVYFGSGAVMALVTIVMAALPRTPTTYAGGVLSYALFGAAAYAAFSAVVLFAIGRGAASTKYAALSSLGNLPAVYMTAADGWAHDRFGTGAMLQTDAFSAILSILVALFVLHKINLTRARCLADGNSRVR